MSDSRPPSGDQYELRHRGQRAVVVEVGGGLRSYEADHGPVLDGYPADARCDGGRGQPLMPWPNRLADGRYRFDGEAYALPVTEAATNTAIHGLVRWANWTPADRGADRIVMTHRLYPQPGWPGTLELRLAYRLDDAGLSVDVSAENQGAAACPFGAGFHPYLSLGTGLIDGLELRAPGRRYLHADERGLPAGWHPVTGTPLDLITPAPIGAARIDTCFTELERDPDGLARVSMTGPGDREVSLWMDGAFAYVMLFTGDTLAPSRRRRGLAVEPMTCPPDALRTGEGLVRLEPGDRFHGRWGITSG